MKEYTVRVDNDGSKWWYWNNFLHCDHGPAVEYPSGTKEYYRDGKLHREDGPAIEDANGRNRWYLYGVQYSESEFYQHQQRPVKNLTVEEIESLLGYRINVVP